MNPEFKLFESTFETSFEYQRRKYREAKALRKTQEGQLSYSKQDLLDLLQRHTGNTDECDCNCPFTANSIAVLITFIGIENEIEESVIEAACKFSQFIQKNACMYGSRLVTGAAILWITGVILKGQSYLTQETSCLYFYITSAALRQRQKGIFEIFSKKRIFQFFKELTTEDLHNGI